MTIRCGVLKLPCLSIGKQCLFRVVFAQVREPASRVCRGTFLRGEGASRRVDSRPFHHPFGTLIATSLVRSVLNTTP